MKSAERASREGAPRERAPREGAPRDVILVGGTVLTMDDQRRRADSLWIHGERIGAVGLREDVAGVAPADATIVELDGAAVLPGFIDAHCHIAALMYLLATVDCGPEAAPTIAAVLDSLREAGRTWPASAGWVTGHSFAENVVAERRFPTRAELDAAVPDRPCVLYHRSMHACILNSRALEAAGLDTADDPPFGKLGRDDGGRPDGTVYEAPMFDLFARTSAEFLDRLDVAARSERLRAAAGLFLREGVTTVMDADLPGIAGLR